MAKQFIQEYLNDLDLYRKVSGTNRETVVREAFKDLLKKLGKQKDLVFITEHAIVTPAKKTIKVDGALLYSLRTPFGYWEAKDEDDDLDEEIDRKFRKGYPQDNIIFEDTATAVLIQNRQQVIRCRMDDPDALADLLDLFFSYERQEILDFRKAVRQFASDLPVVLDALRQRILEAAGSNQTYRAAEARFLDLAKETINPAVTVDDVREMLIQHILTEEIFAKVFDHADFHRENNVARELYALEATFFTGAVKRETLKAVEPYYAAIRANAVQITTHAEKQTFLKVIYETFYKVYDPKKADRLGVVYTPNEIVRFMIDGADWLCREHFGKGLIDEGVEILDPATGTGTFICELLESFRGDKVKLHRKFKEELHANEVAILPYYVANLNIEATYASLSGQYAEFPNLCFVDTLDNVEGLGKFSGYQEEMFGAVSAENVARIKRQNQRKISVIIGNPPYNAWQDDYASNNPNRPYRRVDDRIASTYVREGTAQNKNSVYDMYTRFFRWASDRLKDEGIIAFVTNRNFVEKAAFDGFRRTVGREFSAISVIDLGGDVRANPRLSGTKHNVFGIQTGVAVAFLVRRRGQAGKCRIRYASRPELETAEEKLSFLSQARLSSIVLDEVSPDAKANWLHLTANDFDRLLPLVDPATKTSAGSRDRSIFKLASNGLKTQRDEWVYDHSRESLAAKVAYLIETYEATRRDPAHPDRETIKWDHELERHLKKGILKTIEARQIVRSLYRPYNNVWLYLDRHIIGRTYQILAMFGHGVENRSITFSDTGWRSSFMTLASDAISDLHCGASVDAYQVVSRYRYTPSGDRIDNITDWALRQFEAAYPGEAMGKDAIFDYVYAVLHDPVYRETYAQNLKREFPRIPLYPNFARWAGWGRALMALHIGYETVQPWPLARLDVPDEKAAAAGLAPKPVLRSDKTAGVITLDTETQLTGIPTEAWSYVLGNRCALDWILDQYKEKRPKDPTIRERFNTYRFKDHKEAVIDLLMRVTRVSVETVAITEAMKQEKRR